MTARTKAATYVRVSTEEQVDGTSLTVAAGVLPTDDLRLRPRSNHSRSLD
jgi:hypothetical protein